MVCVTVNKEDGGAMFCGAYRAEKSLEKRKRGVEGILAVGLGEADGILVV